jgi:signal transduction histidine kinase
MVFVPKSLRGQLLLLLLGGIFIAHALGVIFFYMDGPNALQLAARNQIVDRFASAIRVTETAPKEAKSDILIAMSSPIERFWIDGESGLASNAMNDREAKLADELNRKLGGGDRGVSIRFTEQLAGSLPYQNRTSLAFSVAAHLGDGSWLHYERSGIEPLRWWRDLPFSVLVSTIPVLIVVAIFVGWITRPVKALAQAAEQVGRGERTDPLSITGPREIQETIAAFNAMQDRLVRFIRDRTRMLAAISHDFRTPITSLRLRAEMIEDEELKSAMTRTLDEMRDMVQATLGFASEGAAAEETRLVDLVSLVEAIADDEGTLGHEVQVNSPVKLPFRCRPTSLRRAVLNLTDNAIRYGERARVTLTSDATTVRILVDDDGPGIPQDKLEEVFEPFTRLETSRNRETGGVGLGLAVARSCARSHGGDVVLTNRSRMGLRAEIILPA